MELTKQEVLHELERLAHQRLVIEAKIRDVIRAGRQRDPRSSTWAPQPVVTWTEIGGGLGCTRQAAQERYGDCDQARWRRQRIVTDEHDCETHPGGCTGPCPGTVVRPVAKPKRSGGAAGRSGRP